MHDFPTSFVLIFLPVTNGFAAIIIPSVKMLLQVINRRGRKYKDILRKNEGHSEGRVINSKKVGILLDSGHADLLRKHAVRNFCSESVDFCIDAIAYKCQGESFLRQGYQSQQLKRMHESFLTIVDEFISNNSPSEINISSSQKARLMECKNFEVFASKGLHQVTTIFEESKSEMEQLLAENILDSFFQVHPYLNMEW